MYFSCIYLKLCISHVFLMYFSCIFVKLCISHVFLIYLSCIGCNVTLEIFAEELKHLWSDGIRIGDIIYRIGLLNGIWDGRGFEQVTKTQGTGSHKGCNKCDFPGTTFAHTVCYPFYGRFAPGRS